MRFVTLLYHGVADTQRFGYIEPASFAKHVSLFKAWGFIVDDVNSMETRLQGNRIPDKYLVLTFDDGHRSNLVASELLLGSGLLATFFIATKACETDKHYLTSRDIKHIAQHFSIGSHSVTHRPLTNLSKAELRSELADSKAWLEDVIGCEVSSLSAPGGYLNRRVVRIIGRWVSLGVWIQKMVELPIQSPSVPYCEPSRD